MALSSGSFKSGESGNVGGKPRETRNKLSNAFVQALLTSFNEKGVAVIERVIKEEPATYLKVIASVLPKEIDITKSISDISDEQLADVIAALQSAISAGIVKEATEAQGRAEPAKDLSSVH